MNCYVPTTTEPTTETGFFFRKAGHVQNVGQTLGRRKEKKKKKKGAKKQLVSFPPPSVSYHCPSGTELNIHGGKAEKPSPSTRGGRQKRAKESRCVQ